MSEQVYLPSGWKLTTLGEIADVIGGGTPKTNIPEYFEGGTIPWITPADLSGYTNKHISSGGRFITEEGLKNSSARMMPTGTILFTSRAPVGYVAIAANPVCTNQGFKSFVLKEGVLPDFVYWYLKGSKELAESMASGTTFLELSGAKAKQIPFPLAPLEDQKRIVAEIEKQFSRLDEAVASLKRIQTNLKRYKVAVLKAAVEGKLTEQWRKDHPDVEPADQLLKLILAERRTKWEAEELAKMKAKGIKPKDDSWKKKYKEPAGPDTANLPELPELPEGWVWATVEQLTSLVTSGSRGWGDYYSEAGYLFIRAQDIKTDRLKFLNVARVDIPEKAEGTRSSVSNGDILVTITGANVTKSAIAQNLEETAFVSQHVALLKPCVYEVSQFLYLWIISPAHGRKTLEKWAYGAGKPGLSLEQIRSLMVALPPLSEQQSAYDYAELVARDKASLDIFWLRDESLENSDNLPEPGVIARDMIFDLETALEQLRLIAEDVGEEDTV